MANFELYFNQIIVPVGLAAVMFGVGLSLTVDDFKRVVQHPRAAGIGIAGQLIILPAVAILLTLVLPLPTAVAVGLIFLAACPGGVSSNAFVFAMGGDVALSVSMTAVTSIITAFTVPFLVVIALSMHTNVDEAVRLPVGLIMQKLVMITALPVIAGMTIKVFAANFADRTGAFFRPASLIFLAVMILTTLLLNPDELMQDLGIGVVLSLVFNLVMLTIGYGMARLGKLDRRQTITVAYEIGLQNAGVAILVSRTILGAPEYSIIPIIYGVWMMMTALAGVFYIRKHKLL